MSTNRGAGKKAFVSKLNTQANPLLSTYRDEVGGAKANGAKRREPFSSERAERKERSD